MQSVFSLEAAIWKSNAKEFRKIYLDPEFMPVQEEKGIRVSRKSMEILVREAFHDIAFLFPEQHLESIGAILTDPESSDNDRFVALSLIENAVLAAEGVYPACQDSGSAQIIAWKGKSVVSENDEEAITRGVESAYRDFFLRKSILIPETMTEEINSGTNLPAQIELYAGTSDEYRFFFIAKGGGSSNKTALFQETKVLLRDDALKKFLAEKILNLGAAACPPYWISVVVGGLSPEYNLKIQKLSSAGALDGLPSEGENAEVFRCPEWEKFVIEAARNTGIGAQFGGKAMIVEARVIRMPRHTASLHVSIGVSCCAHRSIRGKINKDGVWLERLEKKPGGFLPEAKPAREKTGTIDLNHPIKEIIASLSLYKPGERVLVSGRLVVARDAAHARFKALIDKGLPLPDYLMRHPVFYAGPSETPQNAIVGSIGPTTAGRMDSYSEDLMKRGASLVTIAKGNRSEAFCRSCAAYGGVYLGTIGGAAALLSSKHVNSHEIIDYTDLGMEAVRMITVQDLPCFILIDAKGNDFYSQIGNTGK